MSFVLEKSFDKYIRKKTSYIKIDLIIIECIVMAKAKKIANVIKAPVMWLCFVSITKLKKLAKHTGNGARSNRANGYYYCLKRSVNALLYYFADGMELPRLFSQSLYLQHRKELVRYV